MAIEKKLRILGIRGIPAKHGGFETFAHYLAPYLVKKGWEVTAYCQEEGNGDVYEDSWQGVRLVHLPVSGSGALSTIKFDWKSTLHACKEDGLVLTLGYNTAIFCLWYRLKGIANLINMDGIEWRRQKWGFFAKTWFYLNERAGVWLGNHLVADHPSIKSHLSSRVSENKITTIAYGANEIKAGDESVLTKYGLVANQYAIVIARAEPENSVLEIVRAWSKTRRDLKLVVLGNYDPNHPYQKLVKESASEDVLFLGAIYEPEVVNSLRYFAKLYIHGHQVGGTNPSLVEALGAGNAVLAHKNRFNQWVAGPGAQFFDNEETCKEILDRILVSDDLISEMSNASKKRHTEEFTWDLILGKYEKLLLDYSVVPVTGIESEIADLNVAAVNKVTKKN
jgi:glycosyltransferase involved in cell wall biosynthesis